ncbi:hypothetical protein C922_05739 [Plasmodium inui San Antonio 1]|uniref:Uncharacterized protein n=1 Tax=Plasmodium inui San Antonio 1 TaxID=1237626 RepID=W7A464_9APIC|nr:hypothetical protein C922_05739 [Plasmodium inui San Antonio 1]EUD63879.1 hypothetical protein C922_05739 [Plasmodium inui San Antonio 1]
MNYSQLRKENITFLILKCQISSSVIEIRSVNLINYDAPMASYRRRIREDGTKEAQNSSNATNFYGERKSS